MSSKPRRTIGKPSRFDPTEPLHMTTRHAARNGRPSGTSPTNESVDGNDSRRGSLKDPDPTTSSQSLGSQTSTRERQISDTSADGIHDANLSFGSHPSTGNILHPRQSQNVSPVPESPSLSRKRKRSTPTPPATSIGKDDMMSSPQNELIFQESALIADMVPADDMSDRESDGTSESDDEQYADGCPIAATQSTDITPEPTPAGSEPVSPVSDESNDGLLFPSKPSELIVVNKADQQVDVEDADELAEIDEGEDGDEMDDDVDLDDQGRIDAGGKPIRRLAGRRRADHPDPVIEATLRRQLQLKSAYRVIARALKPVLAEIALKTTEDLEANPTLHEQSTEYDGTDDGPGIQKLLDDALAKRKAQLDVQLKWNKAQLRRTLDGESQVRKSTCKLGLDDMRQLQVDRLYHDLLTVARKAQLRDCSNQDGTDDEDDDIIPLPKGMGYRSMRSKALESKYHSRSRLALESERALEDLRIRFDMHTIIRDNPQDEHVEVKPSDKLEFTVMDDRPREAALVRRECVRSMDVLLNAAAETERLSRIPIIPNKDALGLQLLGDLASRPSVRASALAPPPSRKPSTQRPRGPPFGPPILTQMPPPTAMRHQPPTLRPPISFERSLHDLPPRTTAFPEPFNLPPPPPLTARPEHIPGATRRIAESSRRDLKSPRRIPEASRRVIESPRHVPESPNRILASPRQSIGSSPRHYPESPRHDSHLMLSSQLNLNRGDVLQPLSLRRPTPAKHSRQESVSSVSPKQGKVLDRVTVQQRPQSSYQPNRENGESETSAWQRFNPPLTIDSSPRPPIPIKRSVHDFSRAGPLSIERVEPIDSQNKHRDEQSFLQRQGDHDKNAVILRKLQEHSRNELKATPHLHDRTEAFSNLSSANLRSAVVDQPPLIPADFPREVPNIEFPQDLSAKKARSRASSIISHSTNAEASPDDGSFGESGQRLQKTKDHRTHSLKPSKADRNGLTRKAFKAQKEGSRKDKTMGGTVHRFRLNAVDKERPSTPAAPSWIAVPPGFALLPIGYYGQDPYSTPGQSFPPPAPNYPVSYAPEYNQYYQQQQQQRNSFSMPGPPNAAWPPPPSQPPPSPFFAAPPGGQQSPPGYARPPPPADQWNPSYTYTGPAGAPQTPQQQPSLPPGSGPYNQQLAPPTIAPATPSSVDPRVGQAESSNHPPAFAQQQRQQEANPRRRTHSDAQGARFQHWNPRRG